MFEAKLHTLVGSSGKGWKTAAANRLGISRPTLNRYLRLAGDGRLHEIPESILDLVGSDEDEFSPSGPIIEKTEIEASEYDMVNLFAAGLCKLQEDLDHQGHIQAPYPASLARAFNLAAAFNVEKQTLYPIDLASLIRVAVRPVFEWCGPYGEHSQGEAFIASVLLENGEITPDCMSMGGLAEADAEQAFFQSLMSVCAEVGDDMGQEFYTQWRRAVIENPVAESHAVFIAKYDCLRINTIHTKKLVDFFYERIPEIHTVRGKLPLCPSTGTRLRSHKGQWSTEMRDPAASLLLGECGPRWIDHTPATIELKRPVRVFWALPGWHELELHKAVQSLGCKSQLWPNFDSVDLLVTHPSGKKYAVDVKDHISPISLSRSTAAGNRRQRGKRLLVIPDYLADRVPHYKALYSRSTLSSLREPELIMTVSEFLDILGEIA